MNGGKFAARTAAFMLLAAVIALAGAKADSATPTYIGMTAQDVGVMDRARPAYDAKGIPLGAFRLFPALDATASYDDNVFRTIAAQSDWYFTVAPKFRLKSNWGRHFFELYGGLNNYHYTEFTAEDLTDFRFGADGRLDVSRAANLTADISYGEQHELWSAPNNIVGFQASPNRYYVMHAQVIGVYQPNRLGFSVGGSIDNYNWTNTPQIGGGFLSNNDRDQNDYQGFLKAYYDFSPGYSAYVKASFDQREFEQSIDRSGLKRSSHGYRVDGGLDLQISHLLSGEIYAGYLSQTFVKNGLLTLKGVNGFDYGAELDWYVAPDLTIHLSAARRLDDVVLSGVSFSDSQNVSLSADYEFRENIIIQAHGGYTESKYVGSSRSDRYPSAGIGVKYLMNRYVSANVSYTYSKRSTNLSAFSYSDNTASVGLSLHL